MSFLNRLTRINRRRRERDGAGAPAAIAPKPKAEKREKAGKNSSAAGKRRGRK